MPKIPVYESRIGIVSPQPTMAAGLAEPFREVQEQVARTGGIADNALDIMLARAFHAGEQTRRGITRIRQRTDTRAVDLIPAGANIPRDFEARMRANRDRLPFVWSSQWTTQSMKYFMLRTLQDLAEAPVDISGGLPKREVFNPLKPLKPLEVFNPLKPLDEI